jgi:hypothetical protein
MGSYARQRSANCNDHGGDTLHRLLFILLLFVSALSLSQPASTAAGRSGIQAPAAISSLEALRSARTIFIKSKSVYFKASTLEDELLKREEFLLWGLSITRDESDADLIIEVGRKIFTTHFVYSVIDVRTSHVVAAGKVDSIGGTVEGKISKSFMKKLRTIRSSASVPGK